MADIVLLTESQISAQFNKYDDVATKSNAGRRENLLPHDIHLNIVLLGTILEQSGYDVVLIDNFLHLKTQFQLLEEELKKEPFAVGISTTFFYDGTSLKKLAAFIKKHSPNSHIILGGPSLLQFPELVEVGDVAVLFDGEEVLPKIMTALRNDRASLYDIPGLYVRSHSGMVFTGDRAPIRMDQIPFPNWNLLKRSRHLIYPIETLRGCPYSCKYCTYPLYGMKGGKFRLKEKAAVVEELKRNYNDYGIYRYRICDSSFTTPTKRASELCSMIARENLNLEWSCYGRVDDITDELASAMKEAGCRAIFIGIESGSDVILKNMDKRFTQREVYRGISSLKKAGISIAGSFIIGFPGETAKTVEETKNLIMNCGLDSYIASLFWLDHNSLIWREREKYSLGGKCMDWHHDTLVSKEGKTLLSELLQDVFINNGPPLGSDFDIASLVNLGLSFENALQFIKDRHCINLRRSLIVQDKRYDPIKAETVAKAQARHARDLMVIAKNSSAFRNDSFELDQYSTL